MAKWTSEEEKRLLAEVDKGRTTEEIARLLNRSYKSIMHRRADLTRGKPTYNKGGDTKMEKEKKVNLSQLVIASLKEELADTQPYVSDNQSPADKKGDTLVIHLTDLHAGKVVKDESGKIIYDENIFRTRIDRLCTQTLKLLDKNISKGVPITDVVILSTGDLANGEDIYATQAYEQEIAPPK